MRSDLAEYARKRDFGRSPEPAAEHRRRGKGSLAFVVQQHAARSMHWDFRLELDGVLKSWAVPKGPSLVAGQRRMAAQTEDHPLDYADFEGVIPAGEYGAGSVIVWDRGSWEPLGEPREGLAEGKLDFVLSGEKLRGRWHLVRMQPKRAARGRASWLLIKGRDAHARAVRAVPVVDSESHSVLSGRDLDAVARAPGEIGSAHVRRSTRRSQRAPGRAAELPRRAEVQLATLVDVPPEGPGWLHEVKFDGYRLLCFAARRRVRLVSRNGHDWTARFPGLAAALASLETNALLDGEAVVLDARGRSSFQQLQATLGERGTGAAPSLALFDCLYLDGRDLRGVPLVERKRALRGLLARLPEDSALRFSDHVIGRGAEVFAAACESRLEGIVSKRLDAPYRAGRSREWLKVKCSRRQEFAIVGFTEPRGSRVGLGALLLAAHDERGELRYCGKVGTGFDTAALAELRARLTPAERPRPALRDPPRMGGVHWVEPRLVAEISFTEWTRDGRVRHPVFQGLREDKAVANVRIERERSVPRGAEPMARSDEDDSVAGVRLSHPGRVYFPDLGLTKLELARYYEAVSERMLPGVVGRPLTLFRCPQGIETGCFYQKHANDSVPERVARIRIGKGKPAYAMLTDLASLVSLVQIGALELHVWGARSDRLDRPDLVTFDLDPDPAVPWKSIVETALALRSFLEELGLVCFARATGGKGIHVVAPLLRRSTWEDVRDFARDVAGELVRAAPERFTAQLSKARRKGKILIDWVRNTREATAIAAWSVRARAGAPVAVPLAWDELAGLRVPPRENPREALRRLEAPDPWADFEKSRRPLPRAALRRRAGKIR